MSDYFFSLQYLLRHAYQDALKRGIELFDSLIVLDIADEENP